jgi:hypothetical protein
VVALAASAAWAPSSNAADDDGEVTWSVRPASETGPDARTAFDYQVAPGGEIHDWISVTNFSERTATFQIYATDATTDYETAAFTLIAATEAAHDLGAWTTVDETSAVCADDPELGPADCPTMVGFTVELAPGEHREYPFTVIVPADATPGDHSAGIVAQFTSEQENPQGAMVQVAQRVGARIYLRVDGPLTPELTVSGAVAGYTGTFNPLGRGRATIAFDLADTGNTRLSASPAVQLTGPFGIKLGEVVGEPVANLIPGGTAHVVVEVTDVPPLLLLFADIEVTPLGAAGAASADDVPPPLTAHATAWAIPWALLAVLLLAVAAFVAFRLVRRRARRAWVAESDWDDPEETT